MELNIQILNQNLSFNMLCVTFNFNLSEKYIYILVKKKLFYF